MIDHARSRERGEEHGQLAECDFDTVGIVLCDLAVLIKRDRICCVQAGDCSTF